MYDIHCLNNISSKGTDLFGDAYELTDERDKATGIMVRSAAMADMEFSKNLLAIARAGAGTNNIPLDRCADEGIVVFNTPGANANAVKELVICMMLLGSRGIVDGINWCRDNADDENIAKSVEKAKKAFAGREIEGKKLGVIGLGAVGAKVADAAIELGMEVYGYDPYLSVNAAWNVSSAVRHTTDVNVIYTKCDYITIHVPAIKGSTLGMIDEQACEAMKEGMVFLNYSRDTLVDNAAMATALDSGQVARYITDFATPEVMKMKNVVVTPHLGASTVEAEENCAMMAARELMDYIENGNIVNSVNYPACNMGVCPTAGRIAILHANQPDMASQITTAFGGINIANLNNASRGSSAYTLIDFDAPTTDEIVAKLEGIGGVRRVRVIK